MFPTIAEYNQAIQSMTGGVDYLFGEVQENKVNTDYVTNHKITEDNFNELKEIIKDYFKETNITTASFLLEYWDDLKNRFKKFVPLNVVSNSAIKL